MISMARKVSRLVREARQEAHHLAPVWAVAVVSPVDSVEADSTRQIRMTCSGMSAPRFI